MRLNRFLALAGVASRRGAEEFIRHGRVTVNGALSTELATQVEPTDQVKVDGHLVRTQAFVYLLLNKPADYVTTRSDERSRKTIYDLLPGDLPHLAHVGRLDKESEGLLLLTNDGDLAFRITHPKFKLEKEYVVTLDREFQAEDSLKAKKGVYLSEGRGRFETQPDGQFCPTVLLLERHGGEHFEQRLAFFIERRTHEGEAFGLDRAHGYPYDLGAIRKYTGS